MDWPLLAPLDESQRSKVLQAAPRRTFRKGDVVVREGDPADSMHLVASGRLAVRVSTPSGQSATLNVLSPGDFFGELSLLRWNTHRRRSATVVCLTDSQTLLITHRAFRSLCAEFPAVEELLVSSLATRVEDLSGRLLEALYVGLDRRVYQCLVRMCELYENGQPETTIPLTQDQLADLVGGSRPSVNQVLRRLSDQGILVLGRGRVTVRDLPLLRSKVRS